MLNLTNYCDGPHSGGVPQHAQPLILRDSACNPQEWALDCVYIYARLLKVCSVLGTLTLSLHHLHTPKMRTTLSFYSLPLVFLASTVAADWQPLKILPSHFSYANLCLNHSADGGNRVCFNSNDGPVDPPSARATGLSEVVQNADNTSGKSTLSFFFFSIHLCTNAKQRKLHCVLVWM